MFQTSESCIKLHAVVVLELLLSEQEYESGFTRLMMSIDNREIIQFSTFTSTMPSFMAAYDFHSGIVTSLLGKSDVTP